jgi:hypothetical protein
MGKAGDEQRGGCERCEGTGEVLEFTADGWEPFMCPACHGSCLDGPGDKKATGEEEWGALPNEPCRYCRQPGGVYFLVDDGPEGRVGLQPMRCDRCGRTWIADSASA